jgi:hypothetical protein
MKLLYSDGRVRFSDCASHFTGEVMRHLNKHLRISKNKATPFWPESNGSVERTHAVITEYLRHFIFHEQNDWDTLLPTATFVYNATPHTSTKYCPFELVFGSKPSMPGLLQRRPICLYYDEWGDFGSSLKDRLRYIHEVGRKALINSKEVSKDITTRRRTRWRSAKVILYFCYSNMSDEVALRIFLPRG